MSDDDIHMFFTTLTDLLSDSESFGFGAERKKGIFRAEFTARFEGDQAPYKFPFIADQAGLARLRDYLIGMNLNA